MCHIVWRIERTLPLPAAMASQLSLATHGPVLLIFIPVLANAVVFTVWALSHGGKAKRD